MAFLWRFHDLEESYALPWHEISATRRKIK
jgi:hypothetical protein